MKEKIVFAKRLGTVGCLVLFTAILAAVVSQVPGSVALAAGDETAAAEVIGSVKTVSGKAYCERGGERLPAGLGDYLYQGDTLLTSADSSMGVIFRDDTILSLGSHSEVCIDEFAFDPSGDSMNFLVKVGKGTAQFISGQMAKISPESMAVETPLSVIGIRGTRFLVKVD